MSGGHKTIRVKTVCKHVNITTFEMQNSDGTLSYENQVIGGKCDGFHCGHGDSESAYYCADNWVIDIARGKNKNVLEAAQRGEYKRDG